MMIKPIIKKIIEYIATKDNKLSQDELNQWIEEMGYKVVVSFENGQMILNKKP
jgi:arsenate reductase-like glutaredoxin family protein